MEVTVYLHAIPTTEMRAFQFECKATKIVLVNLFLLNLYAMCFLISSQLFFNIFHHSVVFSFSPYSHVLLSKLRFPIPNYTMQYPLFNCYYWLEHFYWPYQISWINGTSYMAKWPKNGQMYVGEEIWPMAKWTKNGKMYVGEEIFGCTTGFWL